MVTDYILFIHGVNTREEREQPNYANELIYKIEQEIQRKAANNGRKLNLVPLYWGDVNLEAQTQLKKQLNASPLWEQMWFREFRDNQLIQFAGDAALYISRHIGSKVVNTLKTQALKLENAQPDDRLHLVTHSWGTVILFDILFASRWDNPEVPGHEDVMPIRDVIYGISGKNPNPRQGVQVASIQTMGSPVAISSLAHLVPGQDGPDSPSSHDITPNLHKLLECLQKARNGKKLPWRNYIHPGDPIAYPLEQLMTNLVDRDKKYLDIKDIITHKPGLFEFFSAQKVLSLIHGGEAHRSYWNNDKVVQEISTVIKKEAPAISQS